MKHGAVTVSRYWFILRTESRAREDTNHTLSNKAKNCSKIPSDRGSGKGLKKKKKKQAEPSLKCDGDGRL